MAIGERLAGVRLAQDYAARGARLRWLLPISLLLYAAAGLVGTHLPTLPRVLAPAVGLISDKVAHYVAYTGLTLLVIGVGLQSQRIRHIVAGNRRRGVILVAASALALYGLIDEATQPLVGRTFDWYDWLADLAGIATAAVVATGLLTLQRREVV